MTSTQLVRFNWRTVGSKGIWLSTSCHLSVADADRVSKADNQSIFETVIFKIPILCFNEAYNGIATFALLGFGLPREIDFPPRGTDSCPYLGHCAHHRDAPLHDCCRGIVERSWDGWPR